MATDPVTVTGAATVTVTGAATVTVPVTVSAAGTGTVLPTDCRLDGITGVDVTLSGGLEAGWTAPAARRVHRGDRGRERHRGPDRGRDRVRVHVW